MVFFDDVVGSPVVGFSLFLDDLCGEVVDLSDEELFFS